MTKLYRQNVDCTTKQLPLFTVDGGRLPRKPYCTDNLQYGLKIRTLRQAMRCPYIQVNPPQLRFWLVFDIDRQDGAAAWMDAGLPVPYWTTQNTANGHAHTAWGLSAPVLIGDNGRNAPIRYLAAIEAAYRDLLEADRDYSGLITKNPLHERWRLLTGLNVLYTLDQLAANIDLPDLRRYRPRREEDATQYGVGRNCLIFDQTRLWSYPQMRHYLDAGLQDWTNAVTNQAAHYNADLRNPLQPAELRHIAHSISHWTWRHLDIEASDVRYSILQAKRGQRGGKANGERNKHVRELAAQLLAEGKTKTEAAQICGVSRKTITRWSKVGQKP